MKIEVFDFETINVGGRLVPYCLSYTDEDKVFVEVFKDCDQSAISDFIVTRFKPEVVYYAHNLAFDFFLFFRGLLSNCIKYNWVYINYDLYEVIIWGCNKKITLRCSNKLIPFKLQDFYPSLTDYKKLYFPYECMKS